MIDDNDIERFIAGEMDAEEQRERDDDLRSDAALPELCADAAALAILLGDNAADEKVAGAVMGAIAKRADGVLEPATRRVLPFPLPLSAAAAVALALGLGLALGRFWPGREYAPGSAGTGEGETSVTALSPGGAREVEQALSSQWAMFARLENVRAEDMIDAYVRIENELSGTRESQAKQLLIYRWAELDPNGALEYLIESESNNEIPALFDAWGRIDLEAAAIARAGVLPSDPWLAPGQQTAVLDHLLAWSSVHNVDGFLKLAATLSNTDSKHWQAAFTTLAAQGREDEIDFESLDPHSRKGALLWLAEAKVAEDYGKALAWIEKLEEGDQSIALAAVISGIGKNDPHRAGKILLEHPGRFLEIEQAIMGQLRLKNPLSALEWIQAYGGDKTKPQLRRDLLLAMALEADGRVYDMYDRLLELEGPGVFRKDVRIDDLFWKTDGLDYRRAIAWANTLPKEVFGRQHIVPSMVFSWYKHDPAGALAYITDVEDVKVRARMNSSVVSTMVSTSADLGKAWDYVSALDPALHGRDLARVLERWSQRYPAEAVARLDALQDTAWRNQAVARIANNYGTFAPSEAADWARALTNPEEQKIAFAGIASSWANNDSYRASEWITGLEQGPLRDTAVEQLVQKISPFEADSALIWAASIADPGVRLRGAEFALEEWIKIDPAAALAAVEESSFSAAEKAELKRTIEEAGNEK